MLKAAQRVWPQAQTLDAFLKKYDINPMESNVHPCHKKSVRMLLYRYIVVEFVGMDMRTSPRNCSFEGLLERYSAHTGPKGITVANAELYEGSWYALDRVVGRRMLEHLLEKCAVLKPGNRPHTPWIQISGPRLSFKVPREAVVKPPSRPLTRRWIGTSDLLFAPPPELPELLLKEYNGPYPLPRSGRILVEHVVDRARHLRGGRSRQCPSARAWVPGQPPWVKHDHVARFIYDQLRRISPAALMGSPQNWRLIEKNILELVKLRRSGEIPISYIMCRLKTSEVSWVPHWQHYMLEAVVEWIMVDVVKPLLLFYFHPTETSFDPNGIYWCARPVWRRFRERSRIEAAKHIGAVDVRAIRDLEPEDIRRVVRTRVVPKHDGTGRVLTNLKRLKPQLQDSHAALVAMLAPPHPTRLPSVPHLVPKLDAYISGLTQQPHQFWWVQADISQCYDQANTGTLINHILAPLLCDEHFVLRRIDQLSLRGRMLARSERYDACIGADFLTAETKRQVEVHSFRHPQILVEMTGRILNGSDVMSKVCSLLNDLSVPIGEGKIARRTEGIPQGSSVSLDLCNLLLDRLVASQFSDITEHQDCILIRFVDDFLFVTTRRELATKFLERMVHGFPDYGAFCNPEKIQHNLDKENTGKRLVFLGHHVDTRTMEVVPKPNHLPASSASSLSTVERRLAYDVTRTLHPLRLFRPGRKPSEVLLERTITSIGATIALRLGEMAVPLERQNMIMRKLVRRYLWRYYQKGNLRRLLIGAYRRHQRQFTPL